MTTAAVEPKPISRREFLYYVWGASGALAITSACGFSAWYLLPDRQVIPANGYFHVPLTWLPVDYQLPKRFDSPPSTGYDENFWLVKNFSGIYALNPVCPHRRDAQYKWVNLNNQFECPACGAKFQADGTYISGPAPRSLDRYTVYVTTPTEHRETPSDGSSVNIDGATDIVVYTRRVIKGSPHN